MTTTHEQLQWTAGDDWQINATLLDETGEPFDLSGPASILWTLLDPNGRCVLGEDDYSVSIIDAAAGACAIVISAANTAPLPTARYTDVIRIVIGGVTSTLSYGQISVTADPWGAQAAPLARGTRSIHLVCTA